MKHVRVRNDSDGRFITFATPLLPFRRQHTTARRTANQFALHAKPGDVHRAVLEAYLQSEARGVWPSCASFLTVKLKLLRIPPAQSVRLLMVSLSSVVCAVPSTAKPCTH